MCWERNESLYTPTFFTLTELLFCLRWLRCPSKLFQFNHVKETSSSSDINGLPLAFSITNLKHFCFDSRGINALLAFPHLSTIFISIPILFSVRHQGEIFNHKMQLKPFMTPTCTSQSATDYFMTAIFYDSCSYFTTLIALQKVLYFIGFKMFGELVIILLVQPQVPDIISKASAHSYLLLNWVS